MTDRRLMILGVVAALALLTGGFLWMRGGPDDAFRACRTSVVAGGTQSLGAAFTLTDETGARVSDAQVFDRPALFYMGYTFCPDVCPLDNARNVAAVDILKERGLDVKPVFLSIDPKRDTPERLREFTDGLHPDLLGVTGTPEEVAAVSKAWRGYFRINDETDKQAYLVDHTTQSYLVLPGHGTVEFFGRDVAPEQMADTVACFVKAAAS